MDWVDNISKANSVIEHTPQGADEFVPAVEFFSECVAMDSLGRCSSYGVDNEAVLNEFGKMDETIDVICSPNNVSHAQIANLCVSCGHIKFDFSLNKRKF